MAKMWRSIVLLLGLCVSSAEMQGMERFRAVIAALKSAITQPLVMEEYNDPVDGPVELAPDCFMGIEAAELLSVSEDAWWQTQIVMLRFSLPGDLPRRDELEILDGHFKKIVELGVSQGAIVWRDAMANILVFFPRLFPETPLANTATFLRLYLDARVELGRWAVNAVYTDDNVIFQFRDGFNVFGKIFGQTYEFIRNLAPSSEPGMQLIFSRIGDGEDDFVGELFETFITGVRSAEMRGAE